MANLDTLEINISTSSADAVRHIDALAESLGRLRSSVGNLGNMNQVSRNLRALSDALAGFQVNTRSVGALAELIRSMRNVNDVTISPALARQITAISDAVRAVPAGVAHRLETMATAIERLSRATQNGRGNIHLNVREHGARQAARNVGMLGRLWNSLRRIAFYRAIRSAIRMVTDTLQEGTRNVYAWSDAFESHSNGVKTIAEAYDSLNSASYKMGNQLGAAWASLIRALEPILLRIIDLITRAANAITQFFALLGGKTTYIKAIDYSKKWGETTASGAKAAKEWKNQLMAFDEINRLEAPSDSGGGGGSSTPDYGSMFEEVPISSKLADAFNDVKAIIEKNISDIELIVGAAALGIGAVLTFSGANIPLGLGMMAIGFATLYKSLVPNWDSLGSDVKGTLNKIQLIVAGALVGVGAALALSGVNVPLGLALLAGGLAIGAAGAMNWNGLSQQTKDKLAEISMYAGLSLLAVGLFLSLSGVAPGVGLACIIGGLGAITAVNMNWDALSEPIKKKIGDIQRIASGALLALGAILAFSGVALPLGIALMAAGGIMLASAGSGEIKWSTLTDNVKKAWDDMRLALKQKWQDLKDWWKGLSLDGFKIKRPHLSWYTTEATGWVAKVLTALGLPASIPHLDVSWYAKGGVIDGASLIGVGENGAEAVVPLERNTQWISRVAAEMNRQSRNYSDSDGEMIVSALYDVANLIVREMQSNDNNGGMSFDRMAREFTRWQRNAARANG